MSTEPTGQAGKAAEGPTGWPLIEDDLPPAPDPNYCIEDAA